MRLSFLSENVYLILIFSMLLFIGPGILFDNKIKHDFPYAYLASDAFQHQIRAEAIKDAGNFRYEVAYISQGFEKTIGRYPPLIYHISVIFSHLVGLEVYDSIYFLIFFFVIISVLVIYLIMRDFNKNVAVISLPLSILAFSYPASIGYLWGHWPSLLAQSFLIAFFWFFARADMEKSFVLGGIFYTAVLLAHTSEGIFGFIFVVMFFAIRLLTKNMKKREAKNIVICLVISFILSVYYLIIFQYTWGNNKYSFVVEPVWSDPGFYLINFGILLFFIASGVLFSLFKVKEMHASVILAFAMLLSGFLNYVGFGLRSFQIRFLWPVYLSVFFGFGVYMLLKLIIKKFSLILAISLSIILAILLLGIVKVPFVPAYSGTANQGIMDTYHWSALKWLSRNTEPNSKIYFFYGDIYSQDALLRNSKRVHYQVDPVDFAKTLQERKSKRYYVSELPGDGGGGLVKRTDIFSFERADKGYPQEYFFGLQDICKFDYLVFDKVSRQQVFAKYDLLIASELLKREYISKVFENDIVVILKNNEIGADCIEERSF